MSSDGVHARERAFYDEQAAGLRTAEITRAPDPYELPLLAALGDVAGLSVLEVGCGAGELSAELVRRGARLTALDLSPAMVDLARERVNGDARFLAASLEQTGLEAGSFDRVVGKWILHHADVPEAAAEVHRLLKPGGVGVFFENQERNPALRLARRRALDLPGVQRVGTEDEHPLSRGDFALLRGLFESVDLSYPNLYLFEALSRALGHRGHRPLQRLDAWLWRRVPRLRPYSWHVLITLGKAPGRSR